LCFSNGGAIPFAEEHATIAVPGDYWRSIMEKHRIVGVHVTDRIKHVSEVQKAFTEFGCSIKTRLGLHEASESVCSPNGLVLLEMVGKDAEIDKMVAKLKTIEDVDVQQMIFSH